MTVLDLRADLFEAGAAADAADDQLMAGEEHHIRGSN